MTIIFGEVPGIKEGDTFASRHELSEKKIHRPTQAGIAGRAKSEPFGAESIVLSGGYADDEDMGNIIIYTGAGGRNESTGNQNADQEFEGKNEALAISCNRGLPVRVTSLRKNKNERYYEYRGLYDVVDYWLGEGKAGYKICRFKLVKQSIMESEVEEIDDPTSPDRKITKVNRIIRNPLIASHIKELYDNRCQICGITIQLPHSNYIEAAHIKPLGEPHNGPDSLNNILSLCPNHHVQFDRGALFIKDNYELIGYNGELTVNENHNINLDYIRYHRNFRKDVN